jgi:xanthine dehydrogenase accessory factor
MSLFRRMEELRAARVPFVLATVIRAERPASARPGDRALILADGTIDGFVGGACSATSVRAQSAALLAEGGATVLRIVPESDAGTASPGTVVVDNPCLSGGTLEIFLEAIMPAPLVQVLGDTPIARALVAVGTAAGYEVRASSVAQVAPDATAVVVATHGHDELPALRAALAARVSYVALVASPKRGDAVLAELGPEAAGRVKSPAGLDLGARTPGEVAVSILAELVSRRSVPPPVEAATAVDPVCGMTVAAVPASLHLEQAGRTWYFCGDGCRTAFAADPARYAG